MKVFVAVGSSFIGLRLLQKFDYCGGDVYALSRFDAYLDLVASTGAMPVSGDILNI